MVTICFPMVTTISQEELESYSIQKPLKKSLNHAAVQVYHHQMI